MCLAVPIKIKSIDKNLVAIGELEGVNIEFSVQLIENPEVGTYAIVHAGVAIEILDEAEAKETIALLKEALSNGSD